MPNHRPATSAHPTRVARIGGQSVSNGKHSATKQPDKAKPVLEKPADRPIPSMGFPAFRYKLYSALGRPNKVPKISKKEQAKLDEEERLRLQAERRENAKRNLVGLGDMVEELTVVFIATKGAAATTTTTVHVASVTGDVTRSALIVADFNPASGTSALRLGRDFDQTITLRKFLQSKATLRRFKHFIAKVRPTRYNVRVIGADSIISGDQKISGKDAEEMLVQVKENCEYLLLDTGNNIADDVTLAVVSASDVIVFTANVAVQDSLRQLAISMETLRNHGFSELVDRSVVVISNIPAGKSLDDYTRYLNLVNIEDVVVREIPFNGQILGVPHDPIIARDTEVDLEALDWETFQAYLFVGIAMFQQAPQFKDDPSASIID